MFSYIVRRLLQMLIVAGIISLIAFVIIQLPPGSFLEYQVAQLRSAGQAVDDAEVEALVQRYGLDQSLEVQYFRWISNIVLRGDFGQSFQHERPVSELIAERLPMTLLISIPSVIFIYAVSIPVGIHAALHQYSLTDYVLSFVGFFGLAMPDFLLAILLMYLGNRYFGANVGGLFSPEYELAGWSLGKVLNLISNLWIPIIVIGLAGTTGLIRVMRGMMLDELSQPYVETARAKGLPEMKLIYKYPVRLAISPILSTIGYQLPAVFSGTTIVAIVLNLPTIGPLLLNALLSQDMYLAGSLILILSVLTLIGTLVSDLILAWVDPRIRYV